MPPGSRAVWQHEILPLQVISDGLIALAYFTIAITLVFIARRRAEPQFKRFIGLAGAFVIAGGATYALATWTLWHPDFFLESTFKAVTAIVSIGAAIALMRVSPVVVSLRSPHELESVNALLERSNAELAEANAHLATIAAVEQATIDNLGDGIVVFDDTGRVLRHNRAAEVLLQTGDAGIGEHDFDVAHAVVDCDGLPRRSEDWPMRAAQRTAETQVDVVGVGPETSRRWIALTATPVAGATVTDPVRRVILTLRDVTEFRLREFENATTARQLEALHTIARSTIIVRKERVDEALGIALEQLQLDHAYYGTIDRSSNDVVVENSVAVERDFDSDIHVGQRIALVRSPIGEALVQPDVRVLDGVAAGIGAAIAVPIRAEGEPFGAIVFRTERPRTLPFSDANLAFVRLVGELVSASVERELQRDRLDSLAFFDALTSLPNRVLLCDRIVQNIVAAKRYGEKFVVISLDIDDFAALNARHGHALCDDVLKLLALRLRASVRESDTVARLSGDEFVVLAPRVETVVGAATIASKLARVVSEPIFIEASEIHVTASFGIAIYPGDGTDMTSVLERSGDALRGAKRDGRDCIRFASEANHDVVRERLELVTPGATIDVHRL